MNHVYFKYSIKNKLNTLIYIQPKFAYFCVLHLKLSSLFYTTQLCDIFTYESVIPNNASKSIKNFFNKTLVYNFHNIQQQQRYFLTVSGFTVHSIKNFAYETSLLNSITELFPNANWLERENAELHGIFFEGKKDLRNLMLPYGDTSAPMLKSFPTIGTREIFYDSISDLIIQAPVSVQF